jgi:hypothetical protein
MYLNDTYGDCVAADAYHRVGIWTGNVAGIPVQATDAEVLATYRSFCGPGDNGCNIQDFLNRAMTAGIVANGKVYKVAAWAPYDWTNRDATKTAIILCGTVTLGINLPSQWVNSRTWDNIPGRFAVAGGHDVMLCSFTDAGPDASSWGGLYHVTWAAMANTRIVEEGYAVVGESWFDPSTGLSPAGFDRPTTLAKLAQLRAGQLPDVSPPTPNPSPVNPPPPAPSPDPDLKRIADGVDSISSKADQILLRLDKPSPTPPGPTKRPRVKINVQTEVDGKVTDQKVIGPFEVPDAGTPK